MFDLGGIHRCTVERYVDLGHPSKYEKTMRSNPILAADPWGGGRGHLDLTAGQDFGLAGSYDTVKIMCAGSKGLQGRMDRANVQAAEPSWTTTFYLFLSNQR